MTYRVLVSIQATIEVEADDPQAARAKVENGLPPFYDVEDWHVEEVFAQ